MQYYTLQGNGVYKSEQGRDSPCSLQQKYLLRHPGNNLLRIYYKQPASTPRKLSGNQTRLQLYV